MLTIDNQRLHNMIVQKDELVTKGRAISQQINDIEAKVTVLENKEKKITKDIVPPKELTDRGNALVKEITKMNTELTKIAGQINQSKLDAVPEEMKNEHLQLLKDKEVLERDRNKIALKVQKIKDKCVPIIQKEVKPLLAEYDDIETAKVKDGKIEIETFNHLVEFKKRFGK
jgi:predicted  nucleic acid-binding Zn-ribbon protein